MFMYYFARTVRVHTNDAHNDQLLVYYIYVLTYVKELYLITFSQILGNITNRGEKSQKKLTENRGQILGKNF